MGPMYGMRGTDLLTIVQAAKLFNCIILVRHTNSASLEYVGKPLYYPKPAVCKAKTADGDPGPRAITYKGKTVTKHVLGPHGTNVAGEQTVTQDWPNDGAKMPE